MERQTSAINEKWLLRKSKEKLSILISMLIIFWIFGIGFLTMNVFQSLLIGKLTFKAPRAVVNSLEDFVRRKDVVGLAPIEIRIGDVLADSGIDVYERTWEKIQGFVKPAEEVFTPSNLLDVEEGKICLFHGHLIFENILSEYYLRKTSCNMHLSENSFFPFSLLVALRRSLPESFLKEFNLRVSKLVDAGLPAKWFKHASKVSKLCTSHIESNIAPLGIRNMQGVLLLWGTGISLAILSFLTEIVTFRLQLAKLKYQ